MPLKNYILNGPSVVIEDDDRDPHVSYRNHLERTKRDPGGPRGGVDLVAAVGTPIYAPTDGVMDWRKNDGGAGNSCRFHHTDNPGWKDVFSHLSRYVGRDMQAFKQGDLICHSGDTGGVTQHLHRHLLDPQGNRQNPWDHFSPSTTAGTGTLTPITSLTIGDEMKVYEDAGPKAQNKGIGAVYIGGPNVWRQVPPNKYINDREILRQAFGEIIPLLTADIALVKEMCVGK